MFVVVSWISFTVKPEIVPGRMALLVTILLVQLNLFNNVKDKAPVSTRTINAADLYLVFSLFLVFFALLEYATILVMMKLLPTWTLRVVDVGKYKRKSTLAWHSTEHDSTNLNENTNSVNQEKLETVYDEIHTNDSRDANKIEKQNIIDIKHATECICNKTDFICFCFVLTIFTSFHIAYYIKYLHFTTDQ